MDYGPPGSSVHEILQARIWRGLTFPSPEDLSDPGIEPGSFSLQADSLPSELQGRSIFKGCTQYLIPSGTQGRSNNPTGAWIRPTCWSQSISRRGRRKRSSLWDTAAGSCLWHTDTGKPASIWIPSSSLLAVDRDLPRPSIL